MDLEEFEVSTQFRLFEYRKELRLKEKRISVIEHVKDEIMKKLVFEAFDKVNRYCEEGDVANASHWLENLIINLEDRKRTLEQRGLLSENDKLVLEKGIMELEELKLTLNSENEFEDDTNSGSDNEDFKLFVIRK